MIDQVLWTRALAIIIGSSVYSFTLILLAFLVGLAGGAAILSRLTARTGRPLEWLAGVHLATAAMIGLSYLVMDKLPAAFLGLLRGGAFSVDGIIFCQFLLAALAVLPATLCMGGVLPLTIRVVARSVDSVGRDVGTAYSVNTLGAILGSFAAGFIVLPVAGLQRGLGIGAVTHRRSSRRSCSWSRAPSGQAARRRRAPARGRARLHPRLAALEPAPLLGGPVPRLDRQGHHRVEQVGAARPRLLSRRHRHHRQRRAAGRKTVALKNNGKVDASNGDDMSTQIMVGPPAVRLLAGRASRRRPQAARRRRRLRLGRHHRRRHAVPHRPRRRRRARAGGGRRRRHATSGSGTIIRSRIRACRSASATGATS